MPNLQLKPTAKFLLSNPATNGSNMKSESAYLSCDYTIQGHQFRLDFRLLEVQGYDVVLGTDWIFTHSLVGLNLKSKEFLITKDGKIVITFAYETLFDHKALISPKKLCKLPKKKALGAVVVLNNNKTEHQTNEQVQVLPLEIQKLLQEFQDVFQEPNNLPPERAADHTIQLVDPTKAVNQRPYKLPFYQKNAMKELIKHMLHTQMIRPGTSPYSSPVILVKKKDGTWRMCVTFRVNNDRV
jgi:hypothetical protein